MKRLEISLLLSLVFCALVSFCAFERECTVIRSNVLRLHIVANSDSAADQRLKLLVRDSILSESGGVFDGCATLDEALLAAQDRLSEIQAVAQAEVERQGCPYNVSVELDKQYFSTRHYDGVTLPAGVYDAVRVSIGEGAGKNWWCVMFPMLCIPGASDSEGMALVLDERQLDIVGESGYEVRFKCVELFERLADEMRQRS